MLACGLIASSPDFMWIARVIRTKPFDLSHNQTKFTKWHVRIQRFERPWGIWLEMPLSAMLFYLVWRFGYR